MTRVWYYLLYCQQWKGFLGLIRNILSWCPWILKGLGSTLKLRHISHPLKVKLPLGTWYEDIHYTYKFPYILSKVGCFSNQNSAVICFCRNVIRNLVKKSKWPRRLNSNYSVVSIKRTGCNKRTGWSKNFF